jgi:hypothetical protein
LESISGDGCGSESPFSPISNLLLGCQGSLCSVEHLPSAHDGDLR